MGNIIAFQARHSMVCMSYDEFMVGVTSWSGAARVSDETLTTVYPSIVELGACSSCFSAAGLFYH